MSKFLILVMLFLAWLGFCIFCVQCSIKAVFHTLLGRNVTFKGMWSIYWTSYRDGMLASGMTVRDVQQYFRYLPKF